MLQVWTNGQLAIIFASIASLPNDRTYAAEPLKASDALLNLFINSASTKK